MDGTKKIVDSIDVGMSVPLFDVETGTQVLGTIVKIDKFVVLVRYKQHDIPVRISKLP